jgi:hypothetical protein
MTILEQTDFEHMVEAVSIELRTEKNDDLYEAVATVVLHAAPDMGDLQLEYVEARVAKMMANKIAYEKIQELKEKRKQAATPTEVVANGSGEVQKA